MRTLHQVDNRRDNTHPLVQAPANEAASDSGTSNDWGIERRI